MLLAVAMPRDSDWREGVGEEGREVGTEGGGREG